MASDENTPGGRARIVAAAIALFGERGYDGASVRDIASRAGVTGGLIVHHFGTKAALREECDATVIEATFAAKESLDPSRLAAIMVEDGSAHYHALYLRRMLADSSPQADAAFDRILAATHALVTQQREAGMVRGDLDLHKTAAVLAVYGLAPLLLPRQLARAFGADQVDARVLADAGEAFGAILTGGLYDADPFPRDDA